MCLLHDETIGKDCYGLFIGVAVIWYIFNDCACPTGDYLMPEKAIDVFYEIGKMPEEVIPLLFETLYYDNKPYKVTKHSKYVRSRVIQNARMTIYSYGKKAISPLLTLKQKYKQNCP